MWYTTSRELSIRDFTYQGSSAGSACFKRDHGTMQKNAALCIVAVNRSAARMIYRGEHDVLVEWDRDSHKDIRLQHFGAMLFQDDIIRRQYTVHASSTSFIFEGLEPGTEYTARIVPFVHNCPAAMLEVSVSTAELGSWHGMWNVTPAVKQLDWLNILVRWEDPIEFRGAGIVGFFLEYQFADEHTWWRYGDGDMIKYEEGESYESKMHRMANRIRVVLVNSKLEVIGSTEEFSSRGEMTGKVESGAGVCGTVAESSAGACGTAVDGNTGDSEMATTVNGTSCLVQFPSRKQ